MTLEQAPITFGYPNPYTFPDSFRVVTNQIKWTTEATKIPGQNLTHIPAAWMEGRVITIDGVIGAGGYDSAGNEILTLDEANAEANLMFTALGSASPPISTGQPDQSGYDRTERYQPMQIGDSDGRFIMAGLTRSTIGFMDGSQQAITVGLEFFCPDPRFVSAAPTVSLLTGSSTQTISVVVGGNTRTYPRINATLTGAFRCTVTRPDGSWTDVNPVDLPAGNVTLFCDPAARDLSFTVSAGEERMDLFYFQNGYTIGANRLTSSTPDPDFLPYFMPGTNTILINNISSGVLVYRDAWLA